MDKSDVTLAQNGTLLDEDKVESRPEKVTNALLDDNVDVHAVRRFFTHDAWLVVKDVMKRKKEYAIWTCKICHHDLKEQQSIVCESCLEWYHFHCVGLV